jgi:hypothetical protein
VKAARRLFPAMPLVLPALLLSGCLFTTRKLPVPRGPSTTQTVSPEELVHRINQRWAELETLNARVDIQATELKSKEGVARDYTTIRGVILMRKPEQLRVLGQVPVLGTRMFDMVSDGKTFTIFIPSKSKAIEGSVDSTQKSATPLENLRPGFFLDAIAVRGLASDDLYSVAADVETVEDVQKKHLYTEPEYVLSVVRRKGTSQELMPLRVVTFHRDDLEPYRQDIYDKDGNLETQVYYSAYGNYGPSKYPSKVTIKRPIEGIQIVLTVDNVVENSKLVPITDDQFMLKALKMPEDTQIQKLP